MDDVADRFDPSTFVEDLVARGILPQRNAARVLAASAHAGASIQKTILELGLIPEQALFEALADHLHLPFLTEAEFDAGFVKSTELAPALLSRLEACPAQETHDSILLASSDPTADDDLKMLGFYLASPIKVGVATPSTIRNVLATLTEPDTTPSASDTTTESDIERLVALANDGPVIKIVNEIIARAVDQKASDIHFEAEEYGARLRFRRDGVLAIAGRIAQDQRAAVISRLKIMSGLNISEKRRPQDGRTSVSIRGRTIDIRVSCLPTQHGESIVLRLLDSFGLKLDWAALGYSPAYIRQLDAIIAQPNGIFLVAGPTGSGKTTTLYTALSRINTPERKIITVEDPVEYALEGINQVQIAPEIELSFATSLRAILRQDPDVIMIGEIRDEETAAIAVRAALVGRLVLSTIHTNDAVSAIDRLLDLGVPPYLLAATLRGVLSQRLVRRICIACGGAGCSDCGSTGRSGRIVVPELLHISPDLSEAIAQRVTYAELVATARSVGFNDMQTEGEDLVSQGVIDRADLLATVTGKGV